MYLEICALEDQTKGEPGVNYQYLTTLELQHASLAFIATANFSAGLLF